MDGVRCGVHSLRRGVPLPSLCLAPLARAPALARLVRCPPWSVPFFLAPGSCPLVVPSGCLCKLTNLVLGHNAPGHFSLLVSCLLVLCVSLALCVCAPLFSVALDCARCSPRSRVSRQSSSAAGCVARVSGIAVGHGRQRYLHLVGRGPVRTVSVLVGWLDVARC